MQSVPGYIQCASSVVPDCNARTTKNLKVEAFPQQCPPATRIKRYDRLYMLKTCSSGCTGICGFTKLLFSVFFRETGKNCKIGEKLYWIQNLCGKNSIRYEAINYGVPFQFPFTKTETILVQKSWTRFIQITCKSTRTLAGTVSETTPTTATMSY